MQKEILEHGLNINRRRFLSRLSLGIGSAALGSLLIPDLFGGGSEEELAMTGLPHFAPKAKRIIYLFQNGAPSQLDLFDYKPKLIEMFGEDLPASRPIRKNSHWQALILNSINMANTVHGSVNCYRIQPPSQMIYASLKHYIQKLSIMIRH